MNEKKYFFSLLGNDYFSFLLISFRKKWATIRNNHIQKLKEIIFSHCWKRLFLILADFFQYNTKFYFLLKLPPKPFTYSVVPRMAEKKMKFFGKNMLVSRFYLLTLQPQRCCCRC